MTPEQKVLVRASIAKLPPVADLAAAAFYDDLFAREPRLRALFPGSLADQRGKFMDMLIAAARHLDDDGGETAKALETLGRRHAAYGVRPADYAFVGAPLIGALSGALGEDFTAETRQAWVACYVAIMQTMLTAYGVRPPGVSPKPDPP